MEKIGHKLAFQDFGSFLKEAVTHVYIVCNIFATVHDKL